MLDIYLTPQQLVIKSSSRWLRGAVSPLVTHAPSNADHTAQWALESSQKSLLELAHQGDLRVIFSDLWARYDLLVLGDSALSDADAMSLARAQFARQYPADAARWTLRLARQGTQMLVCGIPSTLLSDLQQLATRTHQRLTHAEPLFAQVFDQRQAELQTYQGWLLLDQPGLLLLAYVERGLLHSLHSQRCDEAQRELSAHQLLTRQAALLNRPAADVRIWSYSGAPLALRQPWHIAQFDRLNIATMEHA